MSGIAVEEGFASMIFVGSIRSFYSRAKADEFVARCDDAGYLGQLTEQAGEDLRWRVQVLNELNKLDPRSQT